MPKKDKTEFDLDFGELGSVQKTVKKTLRSKSSIKKAPPKSKYADIVLSISLKENTGKYISRTIGNCSGLDFIKWAKGVAHSLDHDQNHYEIETNRVTAFLRILSFHKRTFQLANPKCVETHH
jgi:hypothetical protein